MEQIPRRVTILVLLAMIAAATAGSGMSSAPAAQTVRITFSTNEDYDTAIYGHDEGLAEVEKDFQLIRELGLSRLRVSFSWSNYEPVKGRPARLDWLHRFVDLAGKYEITLMPYLCYAPAWVGENGQWNDKPQDMKDWYNYVFRMVSEFKDQIHYWELWNEEDIQQWFNGTIDDYVALFRAGAEAVKAADPTAKVLVGGLTEPNDPWVQALLDNGCGDLFDVVPVHSYAESWSGRMVEDYLTDYGSDFDFLVAMLEKQGKKQEIWLNEIGYPTIGRKTELDQARFIARAVATLMATGRITLISWYEIKDFRQDTSLGVIGDANNYHLGLTYADRRKKLGFATYKMLVSFFNEQPYTYLGQAVSLAEEKQSPQEPRILLHPFRRQHDGRVFLFIWLYGPIAKTSVALTFPGKISSVREYALDGTRSDWTGFDGRGMTGVELIQDQPRIFEIVPDGWQ